MKSCTTLKFRKAFSNLPSKIQEKARIAYQQFLINPWQPNLRFKQIHSVLPIYSVRIGIEYRALGQRIEDEIIWFWIGSHAEYEKIISIIKPK